MAIITWEEQSIDDTKVSVIQEVTGKDKLRDGSRTLAPFIYQITVDGTVLTSGDYDTKDACNSVRNTFISNLP